MIRVWVGLVLVSSQVRPQAVRCEDGKSECPRDTTCCALISGGFGCCPIPDAVCCQDKSHCCPSGYQCDTAHSRCSLGYLHSPFRESRPAQPRSSSTCTHPHFQCPPSTTCCASPGGPAGCCPLPDAVCCSDGQHCCPHGSTCDVEAKQCLSQLSTIPWFRHLQGFNKIYSNNVASDECSTSEKNDDNASCCPFDDGECCAQTGKCCPKGFRCSTESEQCFKDGSSLLVSMAMTDGRRP